MIQGAPTHSSLFFPIFGDIYGWHTPRRSECLCLGRYLNVGCTPNQLSERLWHGSWTSVFFLSSGMQTSLRTTTPSCRHSPWGGAALSPMLLLPQHQPVTLIKNSCLLWGTEEPWHLFDPDLYAPGCAPRS